MWRVCGVHEILRAIPLAWPSWTLFVPVSSIMCWKILAVMPIYYAYCRRMRWATILEQIMMQPALPLSWHQLFKILHNGRHNLSPTSIIISRVLTASQVVHLLLHLLLILLLTLLKDAHPCKYSLMTSARIIPRVGA